MRTAVFVLALLALGAEGSRLPAQDLAAQIRADYAKRGAFLADSARRVLAGPKLRFDEYVRLENAILAESKALALTPELQYQRLRLIGVAESVRDLSDSSTFVRSWRLTHEPFLEQSPFEAESFPRGEPFWELLDRNRKAPWAEEAAWHAARLPRPADECYPACVLDRVAQMYQQYWVRYPAGAHVGAAIDSAARLVDYAAKMACSVKGHDDELNFPSSMATRMRRSLVPVTSSNKAALIRLLDVGVAKCRKSHPPPTSR